MKKTWRFNFCGMAGSWNWYQSAWPTTGILCAKFPHFFSKLCPSSVKTPILAPGCKNKYYGGALEAQIWMAILKRFFCPWYFQCSCFFFSKRDLIWSTHPNLILGGLRKSGPWRNGYYWFRINISADTDIVALDYFQKLVGGSNWSSCIVEYTPKISSPNFNFLGTKS